MIKYLILTEGERTEPNILKGIFSKYGFNVVLNPKVETYEGIEVNIEELSNDNKNIVIAQAPKNRLGELITLYNKEDYDLDKIFSKQANSFAAIFLIFDVDHTTNEELNKIFTIHNEETEKGLLLVSSPCIEILTEPGKKDEINVEHLTTYKEQRRKFIYHSLDYKNGIERYIIDNFEKACVFFLEQNRNEFNENNIMEHPRLIIEKINKENIRNDEGVNYRYFTTVIYVALANICGLTKQIDNYDAVNNFFIEHSK